MTFNRIESGRSAIAGVPRQKIKVSINIEKLRRYVRTTNHSICNSAILHPLCRHGRKPFGNLLQSKEAVSVSDSFRSNRITHDDLPA